MADSTTDYNNQDPLGDEAAVVDEVDAAVAALPEAEAPAELARANEEFAERVRVETDALLGKVLYTTSCAMKNSFAMNDNVR